MLGMSISGGAIVAIRARLAGCLREPMEEALREARLQPVVCMDETGAPTGNADGGNPDGRRGWLWVLMTPMLTGFSQGLSRSRVAAVELLGPSFGGIVVNDRFSVSLSCRLSKGNSVGRTSSVISPPVPRWARNY
jgi:transposase